MMGRRWNRNRRDRLRRGARVVAVDAYLERTRGERAEFELERVKIEADERVAREKRETRRIEAIQRADRQRAAADQRDAAEERAEAQREQEAELEALMARNSWRRDPSPIDSETSKERLLQSQGLLGTPRQRCKYCKTCRPWRMGEPCSPRRRSVRSSRRSAVNDNPGLDGGPQKDADQEPEAWHTPRTGLSREGPARLFDPQHRPRTPPQARQSPPNEFD